MSMINPLEAFVHDLRNRISGDVEIDDTHLALYSADASFYRHVPLAIVLPRDAADVMATVETCRHYDLPILPRGAGTSTAGQGCNEAVVLDTTRYFNHILAIDPAARTARVEPGIVLDALRSAALKHGLTFGPDPSTHNRCTVGGMIGNNACGTHSVAWGTTADNVTALDVLLYDGTLLGVRAPAPLGSQSTPAPAHAPRSGTARELVDKLMRLRDSHLSDLRTGFPDLPRRISGFNLDALLPEHHFDLARALVGTEGTCATTLEATVRLVPDPPARCLVVLSYADMPTAAEHVPTILAHGPIALEGLGGSLIDMLPRRRTTGLDELLPPGNAWMIAEFAGTSPAHAAAVAARVARTLAPDMLHGAVRVVDNAEAARRIWGIREDGAGLASRTADGREAWPGWEDAAVPPARLGAYLREFEELLMAHRLSGVPYGHFGDGCIHVRIDFDLLSTAGLARYRAFVEEAAEIVVRHGGSLSGEHGDGHMRAELLEKMYPAPVIRAFEEFKTAFDPNNRMNPGRVVRARRLDENVRFLPLPRMRVGKQYFSYPEDGGQLTAAARRCIGVGACRRAEGGVMCPSYMVTKDEKHSTRGRARLLFEMLRGDLIPDGWRSREVLDALDLCLSCKGCRSDCPVGVDMATYKAEFLAHHYARRIRPRSHYTMGWLPLWLRLASLSPNLANRLAGSRLQDVAKQLAGVDRRRSLPTIARRTLRQELTRQGVNQGLATNTSPRGVILWPDTFTNFLRPEVGVAAHQVLRSAGIDLTIPRSSVCCGLPWISTGQLTIARRVIEASARRMAKTAPAGVPVLVLEPSCAAALRSDAPELSGDPHVHELTRSIRTLAEVLDEQAPEWHPNPISAGVLIQRHCHAHAILGFEAEDRLLDKATDHYEIIDGGCCGLAGNFGFEKGHYDVSLACAERAMLPAIRSAAPGTHIVADGFSCQTQVEQALGTRPVHLAELLATAGRVAGRVPGTPDHPTS